MAQGKGLQLNNRLGASFNRSASDAVDDRPKAKYWMNIGYDSGVPHENNPDETVFISLSQGIPLDTMEHQSTAIRNPFMAGIRQAQNDLLDQILEECATLKAGEARIISPNDSGLQIQIRAVTQELDDSALADNPFKATNLFGARVA